MIPTRPRHEQVAGHRLAGRDDGLGVFTDELPNRPGLGEIALRAEVACASMCMMSRGGRSDSRSALVMAKAALRRSGPAALCRAHPR